MLLLQVGCGGRNFRSGVWAQTHGLVKEGRGAEGVEVADCHLLDEPQLRENKTLTHPVSFVFPRMGWVLHKATLT